MHRTGIGSLASATVAGPLDDLARTRARDLGLEMEPVSLQELVIRSAQLETATGKDQRMTLLLKVARLHLVDRFGYTWLVWGVLALTFVINLAIFAVIPADPAERQLHRCTGDASTSS